MIFEIEGRKIGPGLSPYVIAEISGNHGRKLSQAMQLIDAANESGADAVKMQLFSADSMTLNSARPEFVVNRGVWRGRKVWDIFRETATPVEWFPVLKAHAESTGIFFFFSVFDEFGLHVALDLGVPVVKIASNELTHLPLLDEVANSGLATILSTGGARKHEILESVRYLVERTGSWVLPLYCVSAYPAPLSLARLASITDLSQSLGLPVGFSDHTLGFKAAELSVGLGSVAIEKHIRLENDKSSPDAAFSASPEEFRTMVEAVRQAHQIVGLPAFGLSEEEENAPIWRRRFYAARDIRSGETIKPEDLLTLRGPSGLPTSSAEAVSGAVARQEILRHTPIELEMLRTSQDA